MTAPEDVTDVGQAVDRDVDVMAVVGAAGIAIRTATARTSAESAIPLDLIMLPTQPSPTCRGGQPSTVLDGVGRESRMIKLKILYQQFPSCHPPLYL